MKKTLILSALCLLMAGTGAFGWGRQGHAAIAQVAENHLTKTTKAKINEILHGQKIAGCASMGDVFKSKWLVDVGFDPTSGENRVMTLPHTFEVNMDFEPFRGINDNGRYVKNCIHFIEQYAEDLKDWKNMDDSTAFKELVLIVHFIGDMHCPEHIRYNPEDMTIGYYQVTFLKEPIRYHTLWDEEIISTKYPWSFSDLAFIIDTASPEEYKEIVAGDPYDWGRESAKASYPVHKVKEGDKLNMAWYWEQVPLMKSQLRDAGYRLAHLLNATFDPSYARKCK